MACCWHAVAPQHSTPGHRQTSRTAKPPEPKLEILPLPPVLFACLRLWSLLPGPSPPFSHAHPSLLPLCVSSPFYGARYALALAPHWPQQPTCPLQPVSARVCAAPGAASANRACSDDVCRRTTSPRPRQERPRRRHIPANSPAACRSRRQLASTRTTAETAERGTPCRRSAATARGCVR